MEDIGYCQGMNFIAGSTPVESSEGPAEARNEPFCIILGHFICYLLLFYLIIYVCYVIFYVMFHHFVCYF